MIPPALLEKAIAKGTDLQFQDYVRQFPCVFTQMYDRIENGVPRSIYAHTNRVSRGSGVAYKTKYSGVPTLNEVHTVLLHGKGENKNLRKFLDEQSIQMLHFWVNDKKPPEFETYKANRKRLYEIDCPELLDAIVLGIRRVWSGNNKKLIRIEVSRARKKRTIKQNSSQWFIYDQLVDKCKEKPSILGNMAFHYANGLAKQAIKKDTALAIHEMMKVICNAGYSTTLLETDTWGENYAHEIIHFAREKLGVELTMPINDRGLSEFQQRFN